MNEKVYIIERKTMTMVSSFGNGGRQPGQFYGTHNVAVDSHGNIYTTETFEGKRLQKFVYKGEGPIRAPHQGVVWPGSRRQQLTTDCQFRLQATSPKAPRPAGRGAFFEALAAPAPDADESAGRQQVNAAGERPVPRRMVPP